MKTGGQTVCNWLGPQGLKKRFKERGREGGKGKLTDSQEEMKGRRKAKRRYGKKESVDSEKDKISR